MTAHLARDWWLVALRGVLGILFGIVAFVWPALTLLALVVYFGAYMFVDGIVALVQGFRVRRHDQRWPMLIVEGILGIAVGVVTFLWPGITALAWLYTIAAWAVVTGVLEIVLAIRLRREIRNEIFVALTGLVSVALGVALVLMPLAGLLAWVWLIGSYAIVFGVLLLGLAFRLRGAGSRPSTTGVAHAGAR